jgi:hypothetical protein
MAVEDSALALVVLYVLGFIGGYGINYLKTHIKFHNPRHQLLMDNVEIPPLVLDT